MAEDVNEADYSNVKEIKNFYNGNLKDNEATFTSRVFTFFGAHYYNDYYSDFALFFIGLSNSSRKNNERTKIAAIALIEMMAIQGSLEYLESQASDSESKSKSKSKRDSLIDVSLNSDSDSESNCDSEPVDQ